MPPDDAQLIAVVTSVVAGLVRAHRHGDVEQAAAEVGRLLQAIATYGNSLYERPADAAVRHAIDIMGSAR